MESTDLNYPDRVHFVGVYASLGNASLNLFRRRWELDKRDRRVHGVYIQKLNDLGS